MFEPVLEIRKVLIHNSFMHSSSKILVQTHSMLLHKKYIAGLFSASFLSAATMKG